MASAGPIAKPPAGWKGGANDELVHATGLIPHFGNVHGIIEAERYDAPKPGVVLDVTRVAATTSAHDSAARAEIDQLHAPLDSGVRETEWHEKFDAATKLAEARQVYRDSSVKLGGTVRLVIAATADRIVAAKGECLAADDADPALLQACIAALDTLDPDVDPKDRVVIDLDAKTSTSTSTSTSTMSPPPPHVPLAPIPIPQEQPRTDVRPVIVGAGIVALAIVFWWNRRRRARYEAENRENESK
ncbi:MAG TPA: hypothetical protein VMJ10_14320 [Kofleriaceae bacterium]|nr:hypothetical protein [Kofleriaceae bacterium]